MSYSLIGKLPWKEIDRGLVEAAVNTVASGFSVGYEINFENMSNVRCCFYVPRDLAKKWDKLDFEQQFSDLTSPPEPLPVEINLMQLPADPGYSDAVCLAEIDSGYSATGICWGIASEILMRLYKHWGIEWKEL